MKNHPWAKEAKAFINLDARGADGRELLFQTGSAWLVDAYSKVTSSVISAYFMSLDLTRYNRIFLILC